MELPGDMSNLNVSDGSKSHITVYTAGQSHSSGSNNPIGVEGIERFYAVSEAIQGERSEAELS